MSDTFQIPELLHPYTRKVAAGELNLHCYDAGSSDAPTILLIHGLGDEADTWRHILLPLARNQRVIAVDLPGFGRSDHPHHAYSLAFFGRTIIDLLQALDLQKVILVGSSMGASIAQWVTLARPQLVEQLFLIGGCLPTERGFPPAALWPFLTPGVGELAYTSLRRTADAGYSTLQPYYAHLDQLDLEDREFLAKRVRDRVFSNEQRRAFLSAFRWLALDRAFRADQFRQLVINQQTPTRLIWGEADAIVPTAAAYAMAALLPNASIELIPGAGHLPHQERPQETLAAMRVESRE